MVSEWGAADHDRRSPVVRWSSQVRVLVWLCEWRWRLAGRSECRHTHTRRRHRDSERSSTELVWCGRASRQFPRGGKSASRPRLRSGPIIGSGCPHACLAVLLAATQPTFYELAEGDKVAVSPSPPRSSDPKLPHDGPFCRLKAIHTRVSKTTEQERHAPPCFLR
jgi:hypothetical protein